MHKQTLPVEPQATSHGTRTSLTKLIFTSCAHAQIKLASRSSINITYYTNVHQETSLHLFRSRTNKHRLANLKQHHMPHEHPSSHFPSPLLLTHKQISPREPQPTSYATRTSRMKLLFTASAQAQTNIASRTTTNITYHTNAPKQTSLHLSCSGTNKPRLSDLKQHHMPVELSKPNYFSPPVLRHKQTLPREPQAT